MKAVVMAGGEGSRLRPLTIGRPKPMVTVVNKPVMAHILDLLKRHGITDVVVTVQYLADMIQDFFGNGHGLGMNIEYAVEEIPLGTAGSVKNAEPFLPRDEPFLIISGDALTDFNLEEIIAFHRERGAKATLTLYRVPNPLEYGVIITNAEGHITQFQEKPSWGEVISDTVNTGIYVIDPEVLDLIEPGRSVDWSKDVFPRLLEEGEPIFGYVATGYWCDIGNVQEYMRASFDLLSGKVNLEPLGEHIGGDIWVGKNVEIAPDAHLYGPIYLGNEVKIKGGVVIHGPAVVRDYTVVDNRAHLDRVIIWRNCYIGEAAELRGAIVGRQCSLKAKTVVFEGAVIGDNNIIGEGAVIHPNVKLWPSKEIDPGATVRSSIIWGSRGRRQLFGRFGVTGVVNVDLTPEFAAKLGAAFAATLPKGAHVTINRDPHRSPRMLKRAIISGLPSAGVHVWDLRNLPIPVARYYTRVSEAVGGVHVRLSPFDQRVVDIRFFDANGLNLSKDAERNIERIFFREDFRRAYMDDIGLISYAPDAVERYIEGFMAAINADVIRSAAPRVVVDYASAPNSEVLPEILDQLNVDVIPLNARIDANRIALLPEEFQEQLRQLATITGALGMDLGVRLDVGGEKIFVTDDTGRILDHQIISAVMAELVLREEPGATIAVPVDASLVFDQIAAAHGGRVIRTKVDVQALMAVCADGEVVMAADCSGNFAFPRFQPAIDGLMAMVRLLEMLAVHKVRLSELVDTLPKFYIAEGRVNCPWEAKGTVMRLLNEQYKNVPLERLDGIKIHLSEQEWVLVRPDPDQPLFHVVAEAASEQQAKDLVEKYRRIVEGLQE
ncbi:MAG TPA: NTP transferase domain-containing protein [Caldilineae bacterium]|nr:NTP transferase domain-containing protein [Caldilineae bacterium]